VKVRINTAYKLWKDTVYSTNCCKDEKKKKTVNAGELEFLLLIRRGQSLTPSFPKDSKTHWNIKHLFSCSQYIKQIKNMEQYTWSHFSLKIKQDIHMLDRKYLKGYTPKRE
jgi:hypothetical protein